MNTSILLKKTLAVLTVLMLLFSFVSCNNENEEESFEYNTETEEVIPGGSLKIPFNPSDSLNPFFCTTVFNSTITSLVYRSLYRVDTSFNAVRDLAENEIINGQTVKVYIISDLVFSDAAAFTSEDVVYSFQCAKKSPLYSELLAGIKTCSAEDEKCVVFELEYHDANILNSLSFPIVRNQSAETAETLPIGNGYYEFYNDSIRLTLKANLKYAGQLPEIGTVILTDVSGNTTPENLVATGEIDFCYKDLSDSNVTVVNCSTTSVYLNNLVYMGINHSNVNLALASFRQALFYGIDRQDIVENAFRGYARSATSPFNISWSEYALSSSFMNVSLKGEPEKTKALLEARDFGEGGNSLDLLLVCNEGNAFIRNTANSIARSLAPFNVNISIRLLSSEDLERTVKAGEYDLYIAEMKIPLNMDISQFFTKSTEASLGINFDNCMSDEAYFRYRNGEITIDDFISYFNSDMPFIPLVYRNARLCYTRDVTSYLTASESAIFGDINIWTFSDRIS